MLCLGHGDAGSDKRSGVLRLQKSHWLPAVVGFSVYLVGFIASFWLPEPKQEELPE